MSKTRKVFGIILAVVLTLNVMAIAVFASNDESRTNEWTLVSDAFTTEPEVNSTFTVDLKLLANYNLGPVQFALEYDNASFEVVSVSKASYPYEATASYNYVDGKLRVVIVPDTAGLTTLQAVKLPTSTTIATITFKYLKGGTIEVADDYKTDKNIDGTLCAFRSTKDNLLDCSANDLVYGQTHTITEGDHQVGDATAEAPELAVIDGTGGVIDTDNMYVYGVEMTEEWEQIEDVFEATNGGYIVVDDSEFVGTGALVNLYDADDNLIETYTFVLFGDIDGNGEIDALDAALIDMHEVWIERLDDYPEKLFAADLDYSGDADALDYAYIEMHEVWMQRIYQSDIIAQIF